METEYRLFLLSLSMLVMVSTVYGMKFLGRRNYLLGSQWLVVAASAACLVVFALGDVDGAYRIAVFCDAYTRGFGGPLVTILGLMAVTHGYRPLLCFDLYLFGGAIAGTTALVEADAAAPFRAVFYLAMWTVFSLYLAYVVRRLLDARARGHALAVALVLVSAQAIAGICDFYTLPGDEERLRFYIVAGPVWSFLCAELYYAYRALERAAREPALENDAAGELERLF